MTAASLTFSESKGPDCNPSLFAERLETRCLPAVFLNAGRDEVSAKWDEDSEKLAEVSECKTLIREIAKIVAPDAINRKDQFRELQKFTGFAPRRLKDFWHGYLKSIPSHQAKRIRAARVEASQLRRERALRELELAEKDHAEFTGMVAGYVGASWNRAIETRTPSGGLGAKTPSTADT